MAKINRQRTAKEKVLYKEWKEAGQTGKEPPCTGNWKATVRIAGHKEVSKSFKQKIRAEKWATDTEQQMRNGTFDDVVKPTKITFKELAEEYLEKTAPLKRGYAMELSVVPLFYLHDFADMRMSNIKSKHIEAYRDDCIEAGLSGDTIIRRMNTLTAIWNYAIEVEKYKLINAVKPVKRPDAGEARDRLFENDEEERLLKAAERYGANCGLMRPLIEFAIETTMRRGEIVGIDSVRVTEENGKKKKQTIRRHDGLLWGMVKFDKKIATLTGSITKNGKERSVPLSPHAIKILKNEMNRLGRRPKKTEKVFNISPSGVRNGFQKTREWAKIEDFRFHDLRHVGCTRWSKHLSQLQLMRLTGHKSPIMLARYYNEEASEVADIMSSAIGAMEEAETSSFTCEKCGHTQSAIAKKE